MGAQVRRDLRRIGRRVEDWLDNALWGPATRRVLDVLTVLAVGAVFIFGLALLLAVRR